MNSDTAFLRSRVDAHQHFWQIARGDYRWMDPNDAGLAPIRRDFGADDLRPWRQAHDVVQTVLVQAADSTAETDFLLSLARAHPEVAGVVGWVDVSDVRSVATLERWADTSGGALKSVRPMLQDLSDPQWIAHAPHPDVVRALIRLGLRFDALVKPWHLEALQVFVQRWPDLPVVIDHAAKPQMVRGWDDALWVQPWSKGLAALGEHAQVHCKFSALLTEAAAPASAGGDAGYAMLQPVWERLMTAFGPHRLMWGSDWPVVNLVADYTAWASLAERFIGTLSADEQAQVWAGTARRFYGLPVPV